MLFKIRTPFPHQKVYFQLPYLYITLFEELHIWLKLTGVYLYPVALARVFMSPRNLCDFPFNQPWILHAN